MADQVMNGAPPVAFYFKVVFQEAPEMEEAGFLEVSGLREEMEVRKPERKA